MTPARDLFPNLASIASAANVMGNEAICAQCREALDLIDHQADRIDGLRRMVDRMAQLAAEGVEARRTGTTT